MIWARVIEALGIGQEGPHDRGQSNEGIPIRGVAGQATGFIGKNDPDTAEGDGSNQFLQARTLTILARLAQIRINAPDPCRGPAQSPGALSKGVVVLAPFMMLVPLLQRRLANIDISIWRMVR
jgi:hypothetical protein